MHNRIQWWEKYLSLLVIVIQDVESIIKHDFLFIFELSLPLPILHFAQSREVRWRKRHRFLFATSNFTYWYLSESIERGGGSRKWGSVVEDGSLSSERSRDYNRASFRPYSDDQTDSELFCMYLHHDWPLLLPSGQWSNSQSSKSCLSLM